MYVKNSEQKVIVCKSPAGAQRLKAVAEKEGIQLETMNSLQVYFLLEAEDYILNKKGVTHQLKHISGRELSNEEIHDFIESLANELYEDWYVDSSKDVDELIAVKIACITEYSDVYSLNKGGLNEDDSIN